MTLSSISKKYFKMAVGPILRETSKKMVCNCPVCGDTKGRLSINAVKDEDGVCGCFNAGCILNDQPLPLVTALEHLAPNLVPLYKKERFKKNIDNIKEGVQLNDILASIKKKPVEGAKPAEPIKSKFDDLDSDEESFEVVKTPEVNHIPKIFLDMFVYAKDVPEAVSYIERRGLKVGDNWLFSKNQFETILEKPYYLKNFIMIPLFQHGKMRGFYTRSIDEKRFSTIILPKGEKFWANETLNTKKTVFIFEGIFDAMSSGFENVVAMLSADLPQEFLEDLSDPVFCFDNDETGVKKALKYNSLGFKTFVWPRTKEKDLNEILVNGGSLEGNRMTIESNIYSGIRGKILLNLSKD